MTTKKRKTYSLDEIFEGVLSRNPMFLGKAISLIESNSKQQKAQGDEIIKRCLEIKQNEAHRIGISGIPGVGKSTFIESFGEALVAKGKSIAVLAVDPSSLDSGGSVLGDKTRMEKLSNQKSVFIRPSPSGSTLGGVTRTTYETILLFEAAGFDYILIETVGVGQAEYIVKNMVDFFLLLTLPVAGDDLQGIKRGIMEVADMVAVNKSEGELLPKAKITKKQLEESLHFFRRNYAFWNPSVFLISALEHQGIEELIQGIDDFFEKSLSSGYLRHNRKAQALHWFEENLSHRILNTLAKNEGFIQLKNEAKEKIEKSRISAFQGVDFVFDKLEVSIRA